MADIDPTNSQAPKETEPFQHQELVQFIDGRLGLGFRTPGDIIRWGVKKYIDPQHNSLDTVLIKTEHGRSFALGNGIGAMLPEFDPSTGQFGKEDEPVQAIKLDEIAPEGLPDAIIGDDWSVTGDGDKISAVLVDYTGASPAMSGAEQAGIPNPFDSAKAHLQRVAEAMAK